MGPHMNKCAIIDNVSKTTQWGEERHVLIFFSNLEKKLS